MQHGSRARQRHKEKAGGLYVHIARDTGKMDMGSQSGDMRKMDAQGGGGVRPLVHVGGGGLLGKGRKMDAQARGGVHFTSFLPGKLDESRQIHLKNCHKSMIS